MTVATRDPICQQMQNVSIEKFGFDPFNEMDSIPGTKMVSKKDVEKAIKDNLLYYAHPLIGNINNTKRGTVLPRRVALQEGFDIPGNWKFIDERILNAESRRKIKELLNKLPLLERAGRDRIKIITNIVELARAFIGDVTTTTTRRLEKIYALRVCQSRDIRDVSIGILKNATRNELLKRIKERVPQEMPTQRFEYCKYFMPDMKTLSINGLFHFLKWSFEQLTAESYPFDPEESALEPSEVVVINNMKKLWVMLPVNMRFAILFNDISRVIRLNEWEERFSFHIKDIYKRQVDKLVENNEVEIIKEKSRPTYRFSSSRAKTFDVQALSHFWGWNQNEYDEAIQTNRVFLMPLLGNDASHVTVCISNWIQYNNSTFDKDTAFVWQATQTKDVFPANGGAVIASLMFAFWRLYYDRRLSGYHTMSETFDGTNILDMIKPQEKDKVNKEALIKTLLSAKNLQVKNFKANPNLKEQDSMECLKGCIRQGGMFAGQPAWMINPISLMDILYKVFYLSPEDLDDNDKVDVKHHQANFDNLKIQIDTLRGELAEQEYFVPRFSYEFSTKTGFEVKKYVKVSSKTVPDEEDSTELVTGVTASSPLREV